MKKEKTEEQHETGDYARELVEKLGKECERLVNNLRFTTIEKWEAQDDRRFAKDVIAKLEAGIKQRDKTINRQQRKINELQHRYDSMEAMTMRMMDENERLFVEVVKLREQLNATTSVAV